MDDDDGPSIGLPEGAYLQPALFDPITGSVLLIGTFLGFLAVVYVLALRLSKRSMAETEQQLQQSAKRLLAELEDGPREQPKRAFDAVTLRGKQFRNRIIKAATYEAGCDERGVPAGSALRDFHVRTVQGGAAMTIVAYAAVSPGGRSFNAQLVCAERARPQLTELCQAVHAAGGLAAVQLTHAGYFAERTLSERADGTHEQMSAQMTFNPAAVNFCRAMTDADRDRLVDDFAAAARVAVDSGFDCVEVHCGHGYLLSQYLSPLTNAGASLLQRVQLPLRVVRAVRAAVGPHTLVMVKLNAVDGCQEGLSIEDGCRVAVELSASGDVDILAVSAGLILDNGLYMLRGDVPLRDMVRAQSSWLKKAALLVFGPFLVPHMPFDELYLRNFARCVLRVVQHSNEDEGTATKVCLVGGVHSVAALETAFDNDAFDFVQCGRALLYDPDIVNKWRDQSALSSPCTKCNRCIVDATMAQKPIACAVNKW